MKLWSVRDGGVVLFNGCKAIVIKRCPADRTAGSTTLQFENGNTREFTDSEAAKTQVQYLGEGKLSIKIEITDSVEVQK